MESRRNVFPPPVQGARGGGGDAGAGGKGVWRKKETQERGKVLWWRKRGGC